MKKSNNVEIPSKILLGVILAILLSIIAIVIGIITLANTYPRLDLSFDYIGVIVGILSLLITLLIGWNIYQIVDLHDIKKKFIQFAEETQILSHRINVDMFSTIVGICKCQISAIEENDVRKIEFLIIMNYLRLIYHKIYLNEYDDIEIQLSMLFDDLEKRKPIKVSGVESKYIHQTIGEILDLCKKTHYKLPSDINNIFLYIEKERYGA